MLNVADWSEIIRNYAIVIGGAVGIWLAWRRGQSLSQQALAAQNQARIADRGHANTLFHDAVQNLNDDKLETRLGSIYTLEKPSTDYPDFLKPVLMVLSAYIRERTDDEDSNVSDVEVKEVLRIFGTRFSMGVRQ